MGRLHVRRYLFAQNLSILTLTSCSAIPQEAGEGGEPEPGLEDPANAAEDPNYLPLECNCDANPPPCCCGTPIVIDVAGDGPKLTKWQDGVTFNLAPQKGPGPRAWTEPDSDDAWLTLDTNYDGEVTDGLELFGDSTDQPEPPDGEEKNGFLALAQHDETGDGVIDARDGRIYQRLRLWQDRDHDGTSRPEELVTLPAGGVAGLSVNYTEHSIPDGNGNVMRYSASVIPAPGAIVGKTAWDVMLTSPLRAEREAYGLPDPQPLPDPQDPETAEEADRLLRRGLQNFAAEETAPTETKAAPTTDSSQPTDPAQLAVCVSNVYRVLPHKVGSATVDSSVSWDPGNCPPPIGGHTATLSLELFNLHQGTYRQIGATAQSNYLPPGPPHYTPSNQVWKWGTCTYTTHNTSWRTITPTFIPRLPPGWVFHGPSSFIFSPVPIPMCNAFQLPPPPPPPGEGC